MQDVFLQPLNPADLTSIATWATDEEFCLVHEWPLGMDASRLEDWFLRFINNPPNDMVRFGIRIGDALVGFVDLRNIDPIEKKARLSIAIGNINWRKKGVGIAAGKLILEHGFEKLSLERITCEAPSTNKAMIHLARKLGFVEEGVLRSHITRKGEKADLHLFGMLKSDRLVPAQP